MTYDAIQVAHNKRIEIEREYHSQSNSLARRAIFALQDALGSIPDDCFALMSPSGRVDLPLDAALALTEDGSYRLTVLITVQGRDQDDAGEIIRVPLVVRGAKTNPSLSFGGIGANLSPDNWPSILARSVVGAIESAVARRFDDLIAGTRPRSPIEIVPR